MLQKHVDQIPLRLGIIFNLRSHLLSIFNNLQIFIYVFIIASTKSWIYLMICKLKVELLPLKCNSKKTLFMINPIFSFFIRWIAFGLCQRATHFSQRLSTLIFSSVCKPYTKIVSIKQHRFVFFNVTIKSFPKELTTTLKKIFLYKSFSSLSICVLYKRCYGIGINKMNLPPFK